MATSEYSIIVVVPLWSIKTASVVVRCIILLYRARLLSKQRAQRMIDGITAWVSSKLSVVH